jgi:CubicO group peptidase (beta-lactamase class C family)
MGPLRASRLLLLAQLAMPALRAVAADPASWPGTDWETSTPAREALDPDALAALDADLRAGRFGYVDSMLVARHGRIVAEGNYPRDYRAINAPLVTATPGQWNYYDADWHPWYRDTGLHTLQSTTKSVGSALAGIAIAQGAIRSTDAPLGELLPHRDIRDPRKAAITLDNVLTMRSGFAWNEDELSYRDPLNDSIVVESTRD